MLCRRSAHLLKRAIPRSVSALARPSAISAIRLTNASLQTRSNAQLAIFSPPVHIKNEPVKPFSSKDQLDWDLLKSEIFKLTDKPTKIPLVINGERIFTEKTKTQVNPGNHKQVLAEFSQATPELVQKAIEATESAKQKWMNMPYVDRASIFLKAADLVTTKYRHKLLAATMLGQGKNVYQGEIDVVCELADFLRFNVKYAKQIYERQPPESTTGVWNRVEYRPLEGFVYAVTPFNFTAIASNLTTAPALMGNTVVWKPSTYAVLSNYIILEILEEAGLPKGVINFVPGEPTMVTAEVLNDKRFNALHFTGSTAVFGKLWTDIATNTAAGKYRDFPRIVGETGGKNFHLVDKSADVTNAAINTLRGAFEYQGQKCSATSRVYVNSEIWPEFKELLVSKVNEIIPTNTSATAGLNEFMGPVIHENSYDKVSKAIDSVAEDPELTIIAGGQHSKEEGYFIQPTVVETTNPDHDFLKNEFFGPLLTIHVYEDAKSDEILKKIDSTTKYGLTGSVFANDREFVRKAESALRYSAE
ncbi:unnamed protein product [Ambrosiozyma monospora]|uniref:Multifunctional fusion protein n=1 Tax=Ambrosiozyma monospora TaxID=43982 RepID=A0A9W7DIF7_AMBMO|nr:unnamed protein product [Ambrosiozyma monospora]